MLTLDIVSDIVCPWCFIGLRRLDRALAEFRRQYPDRMCRVRWQPFFLNPDTPPEGEPYLPFLERKFGSRAAVEALFERVRVAGRAEGLEFSFERIALRANTLRAHSLIHWAQAVEANDHEARVAALVERLFVAQFQRGEAVGDIDVLVDIAGACGFDAAQARQRLESGADVDAVRAEERVARQNGISMIPSFVVSGGEVIVGAEDPAILVAALARASS